MLKIASVLLGLLTLAGCARFEINVDSISANASPRTKYILLPGNKDVSANDLQFKEYAAYINRALESRGFTPVEAENADEADLAIVVTYGIGNPEDHQFSYSLPVWGQTGVSSSTTFGTVNMYGNSGTYSGTTTYTPTYGISGYESGAINYTTYFRFLVLDALDLVEYRQSKKPVQLWKTTVTSAGQSSDLRHVLPHMIAACIPYIATNTGHQVQVVIRENDPAVLKVQGQAPSLPPTGNSKASRR